MIIRILDWIIAKLDKKIEEQFEPEIEEQFEPEIVGTYLDSPKFEDVVYNDKMKEFMKLVLMNLKKNPFPLLFTGFAGTGKTYSSKMLSVELKRPYIYLHGNMKREVIEDILINSDNAVICIDEIHNLRTKVAELLYPAIQDNEVSLNGELIKINPIFIATTTEPQSLPKPLQDRFFRVEFEEPDEVVCRQILLKMGVDEKAIEKLVNYTVNIRVLKKLVKIMDFYGDRSYNSLKKVFEIMKINLNGFSEDQIKYINFLKSQDKPIGLRNIALKLRMSTDRIMLDIEPDLIRKNIVLVSSRGRELYDS